VGTLQSRTSATSTVAASNGFGLINRVSETATLEALLDAVRQGMSGALVLRGQAGIGKTALLERAICSAPDFLAVPVSYTHLTLPTICSV